MTVAVDSTAESALSVSAATFSFVLTPVGVLSSLTIIVGHSPFSFDAIEISINGGADIAPGRFAAEATSTVGGFTGLIQAYHVSSPEIPVGPLTIVITRPNNTDTYWAAAMGCIADRDLTYFFLQTIASNQEGPLDEVNVDPLSPVVSVRAAILFSVLGTSPAAGADSTIIAEQDQGDFEFSAVYETVPGTGARPVGWTESGLIPYGAVYFAIVEYQGLSYSPGPSMWTYDPVFGVFFDLTADWRADKGITTERGLDSSQTNLPPRAGTATFSLDNTSGRYSPGNILIPRGTLITLYYGWEDTSYNIWSGVIDKVTQSPMRGDQSVDVSCLGMLSLLVNKPPLGAGPLSTEVKLLETTGDLIESILTEQMNFPGGYPASSAEVIVAYWWAEGKDPWTAILELINSEGPNATLYESEQEWNLIFLNRSYASVASAAITSNATFSDEAGDAIQMARPFSYDDGLDRLVNYARWELSERILDAEVSEIWRYSDELVLAANEEITFGIASTNGDPFTGTTSLLEGTDYVITAGTLASISTDRESGETSTLTIIAGAGGATVQFVQVRARLISVTRKTLYVNTIGSPLDTGVAKQEFNGATWEGVFSQYVIENLNAMVEMWSNGRPMCTVTFENVSDAVLTQQLTRQIMDRVTIHEVMAGIDEDFWITGIKHELTPGPRIKTTFEMVKCITTTPTPPDPVEDSIFAGDNAYQAYYPPNQALFTIEHPDNSGNWFSWVGASSFGNPPVWAGWWIEDVVIAQGATVLSAVLVIQSGRYANPYNYLNAILGAEAVDNAVDFITDPSVVTRVIGSETIDFNGVQNGPLTVDVTAIVQEVVNRAGWVSGNNIMFLFQGRYAGGTYKFWSPYAGNTTIAPTPYSTRRAYLTYEV